MSGLAYLATGFAVVWFFLACYLYWLGHKQRTLLARLQRLESPAKQADERGEASR